MAAKAQVEKTAIHTKRLLRSAHSSVGTTIAIDDQQSAHGRRAGFFLMGLRAFFADVLADLKFAQAADDERSDDQAR